MNKPVSQTIYAWLKSNLGKRCLAPLTSTDARALLAAVQIVELWSYDNGDDVARAFGIVVPKMQPSTWHLAFHAIAHVCEWETRFELWKLAGFEDLPPRLTRCVFEPGSAARMAEVAA